MVMLRLRIHVKVLREVRERVRAGLLNCIVEVGLGLGCDRTGLFPLAFLVFLH